jgi:hypothetical protein
MYQRSGSVEYLYGSGSSDPYPDFKWARFRLIFQQVLTNTVFKSTTLNTDIKKSFQMFFSQAPNKGCLDKAMKLTYVHRY